MGRGIARLAFIFLLAQGCITSVEDEVDLNPSIDEDNEYDDIYKKHTQTNEIIDNFEVRNIITITAVTQEFRNAFAKRHKRLFNEEQPILEEASTKSGFFVSVYANSKVANDLSNTTLWNIQLITGDQTYKPTIVRRLTPKERWTPFFKSISPWSQEYLLIFEDAPATSDRLVNKSQTKLIFSNSNAKISFNL
ncbi:MAG: hypothetical protein AB7T49_15835 [Oligoflexales bacterium]